MKQEIREIISDLSALIAGLSAIVALASIALAFIFAFTAFYFGTPENAKELFGESIIWFLKCGGISFLAVGISWLLEEKEPKKA